MKLSIVMFSAAAASLSRSATAFVVGRKTASRTLASSTRVLQAAAEGQAEVVLVGCGAPNRGMGWYHALNLLEQR